MQGNLFISDFDSAQPASALRLPDQSVVVARRSPISLRHVYEVISDGKALVGGNYSNHRLIKFDHEAN